MLVSLYGQYTIYRGLSVSKRNQMILEIRQIELELAGAVYYERDRIKFEDNKKSEKLKELWKKKFGVK